MVAAVFRIVCVLSFFIGVFLGIRSIVAKLFEISILVHFHAIGEVWFGFVWFFVRTWGFLCLFLLLSF